MAKLDLMIKGGTIATAADTFVSDIGILDGRIVVLAKGPRQWRWPMISRARHGQ